MSDRINLKLKRRKPNEIPSQEYPTLYLSDIKLPLNKKMIGRTLTAKVNVKFTGYREDNSTNKNHVSYDFAIIDIQFLDKNLKNEILETKTKKRMSKLFENKK